MSPMTLTITFDSEAAMRAWLDKKNSPGPVAVADDVSADDVSADDVSADDVSADDVSADDVSADDVDADGMPYDARIHSDPPNFTADGLWRARRGKADEAKEARAAFKAAGGNVEAPTIHEAPALPGADDSADMPPPVTLGELYEKCGQVLHDGVLTNDQIKERYSHHTGVPLGAEKFMAAVAAEFARNETARSNLYAELMAMA